MMMTPRQRNHRHHPLRGARATGNLDGRRMGRWQVEVTGVGLPARHLVLVTA